MWTVTKFRRVWQIYQLIDGQLERKARACCEAKTALNKKRRPSRLSWQLSEVKTRRGTRVEITLLPQLPSPLLRCLILLFHVGDDAIAQLLHPYNSTPIQSCPKRLLAPRRLWLKAAFYRRQPVSIWWRLTLGRPVMAPAPVDRVKPSAWRALIVWMAHSKQFVLREWPWGTYSRTPSTACCLGAPSSSKSS